jgi:hypothetical protein
MVRTITVEQRRRAMVRRHHLAGDADDPEAVTRALIALHATDPASVYLSVLARSAGSTLSGVADALYERRSRLIRRLQRNGGDPRHREQSARWELAVRQLSHHRRETCLSRHRLRTPSLCS